MSFYVHSCSALVQIEAIFHISRCHGTNGLHPGDSINFHGDNRLYFSYTTSLSETFISGCIGLCSVLRPLQHSIGYMGDGFYRSKDPTNSLFQVRSWEYYVWTN